MPRITVFVSPKFDMFEDETWGTQRDLFEQKWSHLVSKHLGGFPIKEVEIFWVILDRSHNAHDLSLNVQFSVGPHALVTQLDDAMVEKLRDALLETLEDELIDGSVWIMPIPGGRFGTTD